MPWQLVEHAWDMGIRYFDAAPLYGYGNGERRMGLGPRGTKPRDDVRVLHQGRPAGWCRATGFARTRTSTASCSAEGGRLLPGHATVRVVFDYCYDGVMRSVEESLERLGLERVDILYIHDPDDHWEAGHSRRLAGACGASATRGRSAPSASA